MITKKKTRKKVIQFNRRNKKAAKKTRIEITSLTFVQFMLDMQRSILDNFMPYDVERRQQLYVDVPVNEIPTKVLAQMCEIVSMATRSEIDTKQAIDLSPADQLLVYPVLQSVNMIATRLMTMPAASHDHREVENFEEFIDEKLGRT